MSIKREWATPITIGAFLLSGVTGILMFFHLNSDLNKAAHEWLSWALVVGVVLHIVVNFPVFKRHLSNKKAQLIMGLFTLILVLSFLPITGGKGEPKFAPPVRALASAPLSTVAQVANVSSEELLERLEDEAGISAESETQSIQELVGDNLRQQMTVITKLLKSK